MKLILFLIFTLQLISIVLSQASLGESSGSIGGGGGTSPSGGGGSSDSGGNGSIQPSNNNPTTPSIPTPTPTPSQVETPSNSPSEQPSQQSSEQSQPSNQPSNSPDPTPVPPSTPSNTRSRGGRSQSNNNSNNNYNSNTNQGTSPTNNPQNNESAPDSGNTSSETNVGTIAGAVVGGVVGLALIGGLLTWLNRRGGCTSRTKRRNHDTYDDFAMKDAESNNNMGFQQDNNTSGSSPSGAVMTPISPFQRRMAPIAPQTTGYMNLGNDEYSETSTAVPLMNQDLAGYPSPVAAGLQQGGDPYYGYANPDYTQHLPSAGTESWQQQQYYGKTLTSPQSANVHDHQMKPDAIEHKPHEV
ncbi:uncharacterized protein BX664DRAFT_325465 [Halteromyces radiatus]|uniref:uncharacterized protein n=1 Tax=Halteromyces radiatus TaxID=101107 RepID=UPI002220AE8D|nr:uncharacterized protein BX664DRAFT_325465 [Halteromyces radiatus]KAI8097045.1 hypothetical protein BX664DRAFT_325465 [Halteromyces radiatus]